LLIRAEGAASLCVWNKAQNSQVRENILFLFLAIVIPSLNNFRVKVSVV